MREPYETLLGQYRDHWLLWPFLQGDAPDWAGITGAEPFGQLSTGEWVMVHIAWAFYNGDRTARIADLAGLDEPNQRRVIDALCHVTDRV